MKQYTEDPKWMAQLLKDLQEFDNTPREQIDQNEIQADDEGEMYITSLTESLEDKLYKLISDDATSIDSKTIRYFRENGFSIFPGERDSFGWLTACIRFPKLDLIYCWG